MLLSARAESNQWPRPPSLAPLGQFTFRCAKGAPSTNTWLTPVFIGVVPYPLWPFGPSPPDRGSRPPGPHYGGPRRRKVRSIPDAQVWASVMSLPCSSSPRQTRFAGLWRGPHQFYNSACPGSQGPAGSEIKKCLRCADTAYSGKTVAAGPPDHRRTKQVGRHQAVCVSVPMASNLDGSRPQWAGSRMGTELDFARRN